MTCYRHPKTETSLRCSRCEEPICADCAVLTPVGYRCQKCGRERSATQSLAPKHLVPGLIVAFGLPFLAGYLATRLPLSFFLIFVGAIVGGLVGQAIRKVIGMKSSPLLAVVSISGYFLGVFATAVLLQVQGRMIDIQGYVISEVWPLVFAGVAAVSTSVQLK